MIHINNNDAHKQYNGKNDHCVITKHFTQLIQKGFYSASIGLSSSIAEFSIRWQWCCTQISHGIPLHSHCLCGSHLFDAYGSLHIHIVIILYLNLKTAQIRIHRCRTLHSLDKCYHVEFIIIIIFALGFWW